MLQKHPYQEVEKMHQVLSAAESLKKEILQSEEYRRYEEAVKRLKEIPELYDRYNEFRRRNYDLQFSEGDGNLYDEIVNLTREYDSVLQDAAVNEFRLAERKLGKLMRSVYRTISDDLELDDDYLLR
ncbi:MAG: YlbF family regulator [Lachnospiraceae bacterium]|nr:YlbF family regulator [Lachnospiraceae bacterium]